MMRWEGRQNRKSRMLQLKNGGNRHCTRNTGNSLVGGTPKCLVTVWLYLPVSHRKLEILSYRGGSRDAGPWRGGLCILKRS